VPVGGWYRGKTREGPAISRVWSAVFVAVLISLLSAAAAHARPTFELVETSARAGDVVHFYISGVEDSVAYELEVADTHLQDDVDDAGEGEVVSGMFTVPDLGDEPWTVTVEVKMWWLDKRRTVKRRLDYLGHPLPDTETAAPAAPSTVADAVQGAPATEPTSSPKAPEGTSLVLAPKPQSRRPLQSRKRGATESPRHLQRSAERRRGAHHDRDHRNRDVKPRHRPSRYPGRHITQFFDGYAESRAGARPRGGNGFFALNAIAPPTAALAGTAARPGGGADPSVVVLSLLALAALTLGGTAVLRRRRLVSRRGRT
jgi:hypothetical protein